MIWLLTHVLAAVALFALGYRMAMLPSCRRGWRWHVLVMGHGLTGCGLLAYLFGIGWLVMPLLAGGLLLQYAVRGRCRRSDR